ncbi:MAG: TspO/MBR family protein [Pseudomarimonas sp.]
MPDSPTISAPCRSPLQRVIPWLIAFAVVFAVAASGAAFPPDAWFVALNKPTWQPPDWLFAPVWSALHALMACSLALLLASPAGAMRRNALAMFALQLALNAAWTPMFFGLHSPKLALFAISLLWLALIGCISLTLRVQATAGWLLLPALAWVSFALVLNGVIVALNP